MRVQPQGRTIRTHVEKGIVQMEISWLLECDGSQRWTLLDCREGHKGFDTEHEAIAAFDARVARREAALR